MMNNSLNGVILSTLKSSLIHFHASEVRRILLYHKNKTIINEMHLIAWQTTLTLLRIHHNLPKMHEYLAQLILQIPFLCFAPAYFEWNILFDNNIQIHNLNLTMKLHLLVNNGV